MFLLLKGRTATIYTPFGGLLSTCFKFVKLLPCIESEQFPVDESMSLLYIIPIHKHNCRLSVRPFNFIKKLERAGEIDYKIWGIVFLLYL